MSDLRPATVATRCRADGEFRLAIRYWTGGYRITIGDELVGVSIVDGEIVDGIPEPGPTVISLGGPADVWEPMLQSVPPPLANTVSVMVRRGLELDADPLVWWQYLPATERLTELLRSPGDAAPQTVPAQRAAGEHDAPRRPMSKRSRTSTPRAGHIRDRAHEIDTSQCAVHILNGEYDYSGTVDKGLEAHRAIAGSTHTAMDNIGHFPMAENPDLFMTYLAPVLDQVRTTAEETR